eukprot:TRINITY_DN1486_c0_g1_i2.p1 TRINITY_DN1486_c0_g1~~TRINITY_DN1486_c0_g1_i2.p1  ORF type:complete len:120 (+),score=19.42 TRINITY_DN1486_c0_g1_i2:43-402(+)
MDAAAALLRENIDISEPAPVVNGALLPRYVGRKVRAVVRVLSTEPGQVQAQAADGSKLTVKTRTSSSYSDPFVEVIGIADSDTSIREESCTNFGQSFDMESYNQLCELANNEYKTLFIG